MPHSNISSTTRNRARELRAKRTPAEARMWVLLRQFNERGARFRRETPIGPYIADFAWLSRKLVIEVDGDSHALEAGLRHDARRDGFLKTEGYRVMRFENARILKAEESVYQEIEAAIRDRLA